MADSLPPDRPEVPRESTELQARMLDVDRINAAEFPLAAYRWMEQATREIGRLHDEIDSLVRVLNARTGHLV
jgi:hypothetical protein